MRCLFMPNVTIDSFKDNTPARTQIWMQYSSVHTIHEKQANNQCYLGTPEPFLFLKQPAVI